MNHTPEIILAGTVALIAFGLCVVLPIVHIVFKHQRQLAGRDTSSKNDARIEALEVEVQELRDRLNEHTLMLDGRVPAPSAVSERLRG